MYTEVDEIEEFSNITLEKLAEIFGSIAESVDCILIPVSQSERVLSVLCDSKGQNRPDEMSIVKVGKRKYYRIWFD